MSRSDREGWAPSLRELDCRLAARLREQLVICHASGKLLRRPVCVLLLPSRLAPRHLPQGGRLWFCAQTNLSLPLGEMSRSDREGWAPSLRELDCRLAARLREQLVICHASGKLCRSPARVLLLPSRLAPCHLPQGGRLLFYAQNKNRASFDTLSLGGRWWIRTTEVVDNRFTVCPLWPLGKPPIFTCRNRGAGGRT